MAQEITAANREAALRLRARAGQQRHVSSVADSLAQAERFGGGWPRLLVHDDVPVGFVMGGFGPDDPFRSVVWKLLIDGDHQGKGHGRRGVDVVANEARRLGHHELGVFFHPGPDGPEGFWLRCGFVKTGRHPGGREVHASLGL